ncbi:hypothetical protein A3J41_01845 [candidate division TM6 bacterium RIFCSPHIGHO2_12_FULL_38_8]|nr:MAG: hypothetical protein A3J41_01845 [candidate division TM6 bacterium RIFCSPHIGHO2_12_FULL_38_8]
MKRFCIFLTILFAAAPISSSHHQTLITLHAILNDHIKQYEFFIEDLCSSLDYWKKEMFYDSLPLFRKHPIYWYHSPAHKKLIEDHVEILKNIKEETTTLLGMTLHGRYQINSIKDEQELVCALAKATQPLFKYFHMIQPNHTTIETIIGLHKSMQQNLLDHQKTLYAHKKPHHIIQHGFFYSCAAIALIAGYATYKINENEIPEYQQKTVQAWNYFLKEYIQEPLKTLKEVVWDNKVKRLGTLKPWPPVNNPATSWTGIQGDINEIIAASNQNKKVFEDFINDVAKDQQLTLASAAIAPVLIGAYTTYRLTNHAYNKYLKHESWYRPMQLIMREMDKILNKLTANQTCSYADDGMLHILTLRLKTFISCLYNNELQLMQEDLDELADYEISYEQKQGILQRMYKTYEFLH